jgi:hypothetical protein
MRFIWYDAMVGFMAAAMIPPPANEAYPQKPVRPLHRIEPGPDRGSRILAKSLLKPLASQQQTRTFPMLPAMLPLMPVRSKSANNGGKL